MVTDYFKSDCGRNSFNTELDAFVLEKEVIIKKRVDCRWGYNEKDRITTKTYDYNYYALYKSVNHENIIIFRKNFMNPPYRVTTEEVQKAINCVLTDDMCSDFDSQPRGVIIISTVEDIHPIIVKIFWDNVGCLEFSEHFDDVVDQLLSNEHTGMEFKVFPV